MKQRRDPDTSTLPTIHAELPATAPGRPQAAPTSQQPLPTLASAHQRTAASTQAATSSSASPGSSTATSRRAHSPALASATPPSPERRHLARRWPSPRNQTIAQGTVSATGALGRLASSSPLIDCTVTDHSPGVSARASATWLAGTASVPLAAALTAAGRLEPALETLSQILALLPAEPAALRARPLVAMCVVERLLGHDGKARRTLTEALARKPVSAIS